jgi:crossover junction endodeoxyribonuclease RusA
MTRLELPWPPSMNSYWRNVAGRTLISKDGRIYRDRIIAQGAAQGWGAHAGPVLVHITASPPDRRRRDLDNMLKPMLDALTHAHVWDDDSQIDGLHIVRALPVPGGLMVVEVTDAA